MFLECECHSGSKHPFWFETLFNWYCCSMIFLGMLIFVLVIHSNNYSTATWFFHLLHTSW